MGIKRPAEPDLIRRQRATTATLERYRHAVFAWKTQKTCGHLAHYHLRQMGHKPARLPRMRGMIGAKRALAERGWANCAEMLDAQGLQRIGAASMLVGDLAYRSSEDGLGSMLICVGAQKIMGWFENPETAGAMVVMDMTFDQLEACWRV